LVFEPEGSFRCLSRQRPVDDARAIFAAAPPPAGSLVRAIIVTESGHPTDDAIGIVTPWDLLKVPPRGATFGS
jgi:hypothetical protein